MNEYVFISYKSEQKDIALKIKNILKENGITCWMAPESIPGGSSYAAEISNAINDCKEFVIILSSIAQKSKYILKELDSAIKRDKPVLPFVIDEFDFNPEIDYYLTNVQLYFAYQSWDSAIEKMIREIRWDLDSFGVKKSPDSVRNDPIVINSSLPHILENGCTIFGRYRIIEMLGVYDISQQHYKASDLHTNRDVLVKYIDRTVPYKELGSGISTASSFFQHPYIASPIDEYSNESYYVHIEPFYEVESLTGIISREGPQKYSNVVKWAIAICHAMIYMNEEMGYIYGQMTPNNIRLQKNGIPILFDVSCSIPIGDEYYGSFDCHIVAPEALAPLKATPSIDVYALGINMYYALTGEMLSRDLKNLFRNLDLSKLKEQPNSVRRIIKKCLKVNLKDRYSDFKSILSDLDSVR